MGRYPHRSRALSELRTPGRCAEYISSEGEARLLALLQGYIANQGDGWTHSLEYVQRYLEQHRTSAGRRCGTRECA